MKLIKISKFATADLQESLSSTLIHLFKIRGTKMEVFFVWELHFWGLNLRTDFSVELNFYFHIPLRLEITAILRI